MGQGRTLLAVDAAGNACSTALWAEGRVLASRLEHLRRGQSERLLPLVEAVMAEAKCSYESLDAIAVTLGPGGFTGVRIGLAAAEGLALAWDLPLIGLSSFAVVAGSITAEERGPEERGEEGLLLLLDAKRAEVYASALGPGGDTLLAPCLIAPAALCERLREVAPGLGWLAAGDGVDQAWPALAETLGDRLRRSRASGHGDAAVLARLAAAEPLPPPGEHPQPLYLRAPDTTRPRRARRP